MRIAWVLAMLAASCGDDGATALAPDTVFDELADRECARAFACRGELDSAEFSVRFGSDEAHCHAMALAGLEVDEITASIAAGRIRFDPAAAATCVASPDLGSCADFFASPTDAAACRAVFTGTVPIGGTCTINDDCGPNAFCNLEFFVCTVE